MKKLILGFALTLFLGTYTVSAYNGDPPKDKAKTEKSAAKKECTKATAATAEKKSCCTDDKKSATASTETKSSKEKTPVAASTK